MKYLSFSCLLFLLIINAFPMMRALNTAATGMAAQEFNVSTISNNIANVNTTGYKKQRTEFESLMYETIQEAGSTSSVNTQYNLGIQIGSGAKVSGIRREFSPGSAQLTQNPFDLMIRGEGFFGIQLPDGTQGYTRDGSFNVNAQGILVNKQGYQVLPILSFAPNTKSVNISENGQVEAFLSSQVQPNIVGQIPVFTFTNPSGLKARGGNIFVITGSSGPSIQNIPGQNNAGSVQQGAIETSNVSVMTEMTNLIKAQRAYEMNSKVMKVADEMLQTVNTIR